MAVSIRQMICANHSAPVYQHYSAQRLNFDSTSTLTCSVSVVYGK